MWTSMPIVVTTMRSTAVRLSTTKPMSTLNVPAVIQCHRVTLAPRSPNPPVNAVYATPIAISHVATMSMTGTKLAAALPKLAWIRRPNRALKAKPAIGSATMRGMSLSIGGCLGTRLLTHRVVLVDERRLPVPVDGDDDREPDRGLGRGHGHHDQRDDGCVRLHARD